LIIKRIQKLFSTAHQERVALDLHIGMPKTGTTAIQNFFAHNRNLLRDKFGTLYPDCGVPANQHTALVKSIVAGKYEWAHFNAAIDAFDPVEYVSNVLRSSRQLRCRKVVMSSEYFWASPVMQAGLKYHSLEQKNYGYIESVVNDCKALLSGFAKVRIIVYLRRQDDWIDSFFNQQLKDGFPIPEPDEIAAPKNYLMYARNLQLWAKYFGKENIIVRSFDHLRMGNVVRDFCEIVGVDSRLLEYQEKDKHSANTKLSAASLQIMRSAIDLDLHPEIRGLLKEVLQDISFRQSLSGKILQRTLFDDAFYNGILEQYDDDQASLRMAYPLTFEDSNIVLDNKSYEPSSALSQDETPLERLLMHLLSAVRGSVNEKTSP
jgi:hypothetical protein